MGSRFTITRLTVRVSDEKAALALKFSHPLCFLFRNLKHIPLSECLSQPIDIANVSVDMDKDVLVVRAKYPSKSHVYIYCLKEKLQEEKKKQKKAQSRRLRN